METFKVNLAGQEFVLPKEMTVEWPESDMPDTFNSYFGDLYEDEEIITSDLVSLKMTLDDLLETGKSEEEIAAEKTVLLTKIQSSQEELTEAQRILDLGKKNWKAEKQYYLIDLAKFENLLSEKKKRIEILNQKYDMASNNDKLSIEKEIEEAEGAFLSLRQEYLSYDELLPDFQGRVKVKKPFLAQKYLDENPSFWKIKVDKPKETDEIGIEDDSEKEIEFYKIDMQKYVEDNRKALELLLQSKGELEENDLALQKKFWPQSVKMSIEFDTKNYSFDLAKYQKRRSKVFPKMDKLQKKLSLARAEKKEFLAQDPKANELKLNQQKKFQAWVDLKRKNNLWKKKQELILKEKLRESKKAGDKEVYDEWLEKWDVAQKTNTGKVNDLDNEFKVARKEYLTYNNKIDEKLGIVKKQKKLERLFYDLSRVNVDVVNNPAWHYMDLFMMAKEKAEDSQKS